LHGRDREHEVDERHEQEYADREELERGRTLLPRDASQNAPGDTW
jgi:hypothetical protein